MEKLRFLITKEGFRVDENAYTEKEPKNLAENFAKAPYETLYALVFRNAPIALMHRDCSCIYSLKVLPRSLPTFPDLN